MKVRGSPEDLIADLKARAGEEMDSEGGCLVGLVRGPWLHCEDRGVGMFDFLDLETAPLLAKAELIPQVFHSRVADGKMMIGISKEGQLQGEDVAGLIQAQLVQGRDQDIGPGICALLLVGEPGSNSRR